MTRNTGIPDIVKATIQSIAFQTFDLVKCMTKDSKNQINEMRIDGGMAKNKSFVQFLSNILQINIIRSKNIESTALGAAYLAGLSIGIIKNTNEIEKLWKHHSIIKPIEKKIKRDKLLKKWHQSISKLL